MADRAAGEEGPVTQFELLTAAAFVAFAEARVEVAVIEAGLGGRLDATNVIPSRLTVLTSVGLDHTEWLGETLEEIAGRSWRCSATTALLIRGSCRRRSRRWPSGSRAPPRDASAPPAARRLPWNPGRAATRPGTSPWREPPPAGPRGIRSGAGAALVQRSEATPRSPAAPSWSQATSDVVVDAAHNPDGARALADRSPSLAGGPGLVCCVAVLEDKDAAGIVEALAPACAQLVCTEIPEEAMRRHGAARRAFHARPEAGGPVAAGGVEAEAVARDPIERRWGRATESGARARRGGAGRRASHYLLSCIWTERPVQSC